MSINGYSMTISIQTYQKILQNTEWIFLFSAGAAMLTGDFLPCGGFAVASLEPLPRKRDSGVQSGGHAAFGQTSCWQVMAGHCSFVTVVPRPGPGRQCVPDGGFWHSAIVCVLGGGGAHLHALSPVFLMCLLPAAIWPVVPHVVCMRAFVFACVPVCLLEVQGIPNRAIAYENAFPAAPAVRRFGKPA